MNLSAIYCMNYALVIARGEAKCNLYITMVKLHKNSLNTVLVNHFNPCHESYTSFVVVVFIRILVLVF